MLTGKNYDITLNSKFEQNNIANGKTCTRIVGHIQDILRF